MSLLNSSLRLLIICLISFFILFILKIFPDLALPYKDGIYIISGAFLISLLINYIFTRGFNKDRKNFLSYTLIAISLKFLLYLILILIYYFLLKKFSWQFVLTFFIIYLLFTSYLLFSFIRKLKKTKPQSK